MKKGRMRGKTNGSSEREDNWGKEEGEGLSPVKQVVNGFRAAFAMFSTLPVKNVDWREENLSYMLLFFPLVGYLIALGVFFLYFFGTKLGYQPLFLSSLMVLLPVLLSGGIHVDGLIDTQDALSSWQGRERRLEILKDSHVGAFGVIKGLCFFLGELGCFCELLCFTKSIVLMGLCFISSRCLSALMVVTLPKAKKEGTVATFSRESRGGLVRVVQLLHLGLLFLAGLCISPISALSLAAFSLAFYYWFRNMAIQSFGGITGDLNGFFVCYYEFGSALVLALGGRILASF